MISIDTTRCEGCGTCIEDCISHTLVLYDGKAHARGACFQCGHCVALCPYEAISIPNYSDPCIPYDAQTFDLQTINLVNTIKFRRSVRRFKDQPITYDDLHILMDAAAHTPTAKNTQSCRFVFIQDSLTFMKELVWNDLQFMYDNDLYDEEQFLGIPYESFERFITLRKADHPQDFLFRNAPAVLCIQALDPLDAGLAASAIELVGSTRGIGVLYNGFLRRIIAGMPEVQKYLDMDLEEKPLAVCMLVGYSDVAYLRTAPRRNPSVVLR